MFIVNSIVPIILLIALGKALRHTGFLPEPFFRGLNRLVFWFALPALLISNISVAELEPGTLSRIALLLLCGTLLTLLTAWLIAHRLDLTMPATGSFIQGSFRGNGAFIALPVILYSLGKTDPRAETLGTVMLAPVVVLFNILGVLILTHYGRGGKRSGSSLLPFLLELIRNPLIAACALGIGLNLSGLRLPEYLFRPLDALGHAALPLVLMAIGASLEMQRLRGAASPTLIASLLKVAVAPAVGFLLSGLFGLSQTEKMIAIFYLAAPAAGMSYVMADVMGNDGPLAGRIVALSTLLSGITIPIIMAIGC